MQSDNSISLSLKDNEALRAALNGKSPGDTCKLEVEVQVNEISADMLTGSINSVAVVDYDDPEEEAAEVVKAAPPTPPPAKAKIPPVAKSPLENDQQTRNV